jgi:hypothetical protein
VTKFRKKPVVIEAVQLTWSTWSEVCELMGDAIGPGRAHGVHRDDGRIELAIPTLEGTHTASEGDWIIRGIKGEFYPCKPDIFAATYEAVDG